MHWESSAAREVRIEEGRARGERGLETEEDVLWWLGDTRGDLAIFRTRDTERDVLLTLATGLFNMEQDRLHLYIPAQLEQNGVGHRHLGGLGPVGLGPVRVCLGPSLLLYCGLGSLNNCLGPSLLLARVLSTCGMFGLCPPVAGPYYCYVR